MSSLLVCLALLLGASEGRNEPCVDMHGRLVAPDIHYVPGPDTCTLCVCDNGAPKLCKAVLCSPPMDCKSFRLGASCCDFICLDDTLNKNDVMHDDLGMRLVACVIMIILSVSLLFFLVHRLRKRKIRGRQNRQLTEEDHSMASIGYIAGSIGYLPGSMGYMQDSIDCPYDADPRVNFALWKPPESYFPRGEAPPPYEEAVAAAQAEAAAPARMAIANNNRPPQVVDMLTVALPTAGQNPEPENQQAISSDAFYEDVQVATGSSVVEYVNVEQTRDMMAAALESNLAAMNALNRSTCSCPDENDDYRSECENCKSAHELDQEPAPLPPQETMTLQRRPHSVTPNTANGYRTSLTLPTRRSGLLTDSPPFSVHLPPPPNWSDSSSSSRSQSPDHSELNRTSSTGLDEASTHM
ncbi:integral membrane protein DGCR2/IDD-like isoform X2 [Neocloeon triangulifer]|uniref:integral membrane protein DGCR2/IDD-like isoform X2 n=1 Tax=Neocloeon triangulifer TaxID=2078957 RepID=UPI00286ED5C3|nr:integral membrane protein DGCR2/IDD-like isoform X2 [Neocloeon triangulifer]